MRRNATNLIPGMSLLGRGNGLFVPPAENSVLSLTDAERLNLPLSTPVGQRVSVTDSFQLSGGTTVDGFYPPTGTTNGRPYYNLSGSGSTSDALSSVYWDTVGWNILDSNGDAIFYAAEDVEFPWLVSVWVGTPPLPTLTNPVLQELQAPSSVLSAGFVGGSGTSAAIGLYVCSTPGSPHETYALLGAIGAARIYVNNEIEIPQWEIRGESEEQYYKAPLTDYPWDAVWEPNGGGVEPAPTVTAVTQGELDAGLDLTLAGTTAARGAYPVFSTLTGFKSYKNVTGEYYVGTEANETDLTNSPAPSGASQFYYTGTSLAAFPWQEDPMLVGSDGASPVPLIQRNDIAARANWVPI